MTTEKVYVDIIAMNENGYELYREIGWEVDAVFEGNATPYCDSVGNGIGQAIVRMILDDAHAVRVERSAKPPTPEPQETDADPYAWCPKVPVASGQLFCGQPSVLICDGRCDKANGRNSPSTPKGALAPADPGTIEGTDLKPRRRDEQHNRWCWRECERARISAPGNPVIHLEEDE